MSTLKSPFPTPTPSSPDAPPPSYSESVNAPLTSHVSTVVDLDISPHLAGDHATTTIILVPSNISTLIASPASGSPKDPSAGSFTGEILVGFPANDSPAIVRISGHDNRLEFWQRAAALGELKRQLSGRLAAQGYRISRDPHHQTKPSQTSARMPGSTHVDWKSVERSPLREGEATVSTEMKEVCLRIENEMGLYETRTGKAVVVRIVVGRAEMDDCWDV
ncbi:MAG: hypothetical protein LQ348_004505 [Seirophora lacunosa]|nr:MAG: hypothetical protein LQ348_004505 [Seirophora lacunosa]